MELKELKELDYTGEDRIAICDYDTRVVSYQLTQDITNPLEWFADNNLELIITSPYDCTGDWFSAYQEYDEENNILYDIQYIDC